MFIKLRNDAAEGGPENTRIAICEREDLGLCVRAQTPCPRGTVLDCFSGEIGTDLLQHSLQVRPGLHISGTRFIGFLSHGCDPNCRLDMERFELIALRDIAEGELLTIDYAATEDVLYRQFECHCGTSTCRGWITGRTEGMSEEGTAVLARRTAAKRQ